jgi:hypothetical protein
MKKLLAKKNPQKKQKNKTKIEQFVDKAFNVIAKKRYAEICAEYSFRFIDEYDDFLVDEDEINDICKNITETAVFNAIKKNKIFQKHIDGCISYLVSDLIINTKEIAKHIEQEKIYIEKNRIQQEKQAAKQKAEKAKLVEKLKKSAAQKAILAEGMTKTQKSALKKLYNIDINNISKV